MRKLWIGALVLLGLVTAGCGSGDADDSATSVQLVRAAASQTASSSMRATFTVSGADVPGDGVTVDAEYDLEGQRARVDLPGDAFGLGGSFTGIVDLSDSPVLWLQIPGAARLIGAGWVEIDAADLEAVAAGHGFDLDGLRSQAEQIDPTAALDALRGAHKVENLGREDVRGTETTHYLVTIDLDAAIEAAPEESREALRSKLDEYGVDEIEMDVWIDDDDRVRRYRQVVDPADFANLPDDAPTSPVTVEFEFFDFGADVNVAPPPADDIVSLSDVIGLFGGSD